MNVHLSRFAGTLTCPHCSQRCSSPDWPLNGDHVPFYSQETAGTFVIPITCGACGKAWYVVWDEDPGPVMPLFSATSTPESPPLHSSCWFCQRAPSDLRKSLVVRFERFQTPEVKLHVPRCQTCYLAHEAEKKSHLKLSVILAVILAPFGYYVAGIFKWPFLPTIFLTVGLGACGYFLAAIARLALPGGRLRMTHIERLNSFPAYKEHEANPDRKATYVGW